MCVWGWSGTSHYNFWLFYDHKPNFVWPALSLWQPHAESQHFCRVERGQTILCCLYKSNLMWGRPTCRMFGCYVLNRSRMDSAPCGAWGDGVGGVTYGAGAQAKWWVCYVQTHHSMFFCLLLNWKMSLQETCWAVSFHLFNFGMPVISKWML